MKIFVTFKNIISTVIIDPNIFPLIPNNFHITFLKINYPNNYNFLYILKNRSIFQYSK